MTVAVSDTIHTCVLPAPCRRRPWSVTSLCCWFINKVGWEFFTFRRVAGLIISGTVAGWSRAKWLFRSLIGLSIIFMWLSSCIITALSHDHQTAATLMSTVIGHVSVFPFIAAKSITCTNPAIVCTVKWSSELRSVATIVAGCRIIATST